MFALNISYSFRFLFGSAILLMLACSACRDNNPVAPDEGDLTDIPYNPQPYTIKKPSHFPEMLIPADNPMTVEGVNLGRRLFYDPILSGDSTQSCSSCHLPTGNFTDNKAVSKGIDGINGRRSAMSLINIGYTKAFFFWDGRSPTLEDQALHPVEDPIEMHNTWANALGKIKNKPQYTEWFRKAFGITHRDSINKVLAAKAIAQFERTLVSSGNSKYDLAIYKGETDLDDDELDGKLMFFDEGSSLGLPDAQCFHCHGGVTLSGGQFFNNGLENITSPNDFPDLGLGGFTKNPADNGKFRASTLRNISMSAPYMHDGRFATLEEVLDHYGDHDKESPNEDQFIDQIGFVVPGTNPVQFTKLTTEHKQKLLKFLKTLDDPDFVNNPAFQNPW